MAEHFLTKTQIDLRQCLEVRGGLSLETYEELSEVLRRRAGVETAQVFAEPLLSRGNDQVAPSVSWYSDVKGNAQRFARLDEAQQAALSAELRRRLAPLDALLDDPEIGPLVASALHIADPGDIWSLDGVPVITNWGMLPAGMSRDAAARADHYARTMGRFLPLAAAPPLTETERTTLRKASAGSGDDTPAAPRAAGAGTAAAASAAGAAGMAAGAASARNDPPPEQPPHQPPRAAASEGPRRVPLWAWLPLLLLLLITGGALVWLLIPGNRIFPDRAADQVVTDEAALAASANVNGALQSRLAELQSALDGAVCEADGTLLMPDGRTIEGLLPPDPNDRTDIPGAVRPADRTAILPPDPQRVRVPDQSNPKETQALLAYIEERTAIVLAPTPQGLSSGTGFFVGPDLLVTNFHVIAAPGASNIYVTNNDLGGVQEAQILKSMGPFEATGGDFALLRVPGANQPSFIVLQPNESLRLQSVIAAGYPGDLLQSDAQFQQLRTGDSTAVPELAVTDGTVSAEQVLNDRSRVVVHSAPISQGNSGGPLIDMCGRLIGVNTFVKRGALRNLNFALSASDLTRFLENTGALPQVVTQTCAPEIQRPVPPETAQATAPVEAPAPIPESGSGLPKLPALTPRTD